MNITASVLFVVLASVVLAGGAGRGGLVRQPLFALGGITVQGDVTHNNAVTLRANVAPRLAGNFFTVDLAPRARGLRVGALGAPGGGAARVPEPAARDAAGAPGRWRYWGAEGESRLVNSFGEVFEANAGDVEHEDLPRLDGPDGQAGAGAGHVPRAGAAVRAAGPGVEQLELTEPRQLARAAGHRRGDRAGPRHAATRWWRARSASLQTLTQVAAQYGRSRRRSSRPTCGTATAMRCGCAASPPVDADDKTNRREQEVNDMAKEYKDLVVGLDIGTAKVMVVVAEVMPGGELKLAGLGVAPQQRAQARRGGEHRRHGAEHPAGAEGGRADGRLQDHAASTPASPAATSAASIPAAWWR